MDNKTYRKELIRRIYRFSLSVTRLFRSEIRHDSATYIILKQLIRSSTSVGANVVEAQAASSRKDFVNFISYALKSANESMYWLMLLRDYDENLKPSAVKILLECQEIKKILGSTVRKLKSKKM